MSALQLERRRLGDHQPRRDGGTARHRQHLCCGPCRAYSGPWVRRVASGPLARVHLLHSAVQPCRPAVDFIPPAGGPDGEVLPASLSVWPAGNDTREQYGFHWALGLEEAEHLATVLLDAVRAAREMFPES